MVNDGQQTPDLDTSVPQTARIWNYLLGGRDNFAVDRAVGDQILAGQPELAENARWNESAAAPYRLRSPERLARFFDGLELVEPGLASVTRWRPEAEAREIDQYGAVGRKP